MGAQFSHTVDFKGFLDAVSIVLKYCYSYICCYLFCFTDNRMFVLLVMKYCVLLS